MKTKIVVMIGIVILLGAWWIGQNRASPNSDSFGSASLDKWTVASGIWTVVDGVLVNEGTGLTSDRNLILFNTLPNSENFELSCKMLLSENNGVFLPEAQFVLGYQDINNYYFVGLGAYERYVGVGRFNEGVNSLQSAEGSKELLATNHWYNMKVSVVDATVTVYVNDVQALVFTEDFSEGYVGLTGWYGTVYFDDFELKIN